jgi:hypothetical protein
MTTFLQPGAGSTALAALRGGEHFKVAQATANPAARDVCGSGREN